MNTISQGASIRLPKPQQWTVVRASVRGKAHIDNGTPNQDAEHVIVSPDCTRVAAAVCDGAGTAPRAEDGARHFASRICARLYELGEKVARREVGASNRNQLTDEVFGLVQAVRTELDPDGSHLAEYHCTLVAILITPELRLFLKLGDSLLLKTRFADTVDGKVDFFVDLAMTQQERSDYANETHFVTQPEWRDHLVRDTIPLDSPDMMYALMTDGAGDIALQGQAAAGQKRVYRGFFGNLLANILALPMHDRDVALHAALEHRATHRLTGDDKTVVLLLRSDALAYAGREPLLEEPLATVPATPSAPSPLDPGAPADPVATAASGVSDKHVAPGRGQSSSVSSSPAVASSAALRAAPVATGASAARSASANATPAPPSSASLPLPSAGMTADGKGTAPLWVKGAYIVAGTLAVVMTGTLLVKVLDRYGTARAPSTDVKNTGSASIATQSIPATDKVPNNGAPVLPAAANAGDPPTALPAHVQAAPPPGAVQVAGVHAPNAQGNAPAKVADAARVIVPVKRGASAVHIVELVVPNTTGVLSKGSKRETYEVENFGSIVTKCTPANAAGNPMVDVTCEFSIRANPAANLGKLDVALAEFSPLGQLHGDARVTVDVKAAAATGASTPKAAQPGQKAGDPPHAERHAEE